MSNKHFEQLLYRRSSWITGSEQRHSLFRGALVMAVQCVACIAIAWVVAQGWWWLAAPDRSAVAVTDSTTLAEQSRQVLVRHFFGEVSASLLSNETSTHTSSGAINPQWRLLGTYVDSGSRSRAILSLENGADVEVVRVGATLPSGHDVIEVWPESVVLMKDAQRSELTLRPVVNAEQTLVSPDNYSERANPAPFNRNHR